MAKSKDLHLQGDAGPKCGGKQSTKSNQKRVHGGGHYDLTIDRKLRVFIADGVFGRHSESRPIWEVILENMKDVPAEEFARLPKDGASEHDHYLYGHPKRDQ